MTEGRIRKALLDRLPRDGRWIYLAPLYAGLQPVVLQSNLLIDVLCGLVAGGVVQRRGYRYRLL